MTGRQMARVDHDGSVYSVAFSPNGTYMATTCSAEPARVLYWRPADLVALASSRLTRNLTYPEWQLYVADEPYRRTCANLPVHPTFIEGARDLAREGDIEGAVAIFRRAIKLDSSLKLDPQAEAKKYAAESLAAKGKELAEAGDINGAMDWFRKAIELDVRLELDPEKEARRYAAEALREEGRELGEAGDIESSRARFQEAQDLDPDPELDPEQEAHRYAAKGLVREGRNLVVFGDIAAATATFEEALELDTNLKLDIEAEKSRYDVNMPIIADNIATKRKTSEKTWDWTVFIQGPEHILDQVDSVEYTLHPSFRSPQQIVRNRGTGFHAFPLSESGWGVFTVKIRVFFKNGHVQHLSHLLRFADSRQ
jgi:tetratricopeptide (TPR) repeat protein